MRPLERRAWRAGAWLMLLVGGVAAQSSGGAYVLARHSIDGGGGRAVGGAFTLEGSAGQPDAGPVPAGAMAGGPYALAGGFWPEAGASAANVDVFADGFEGG